MTSKSREGWDCGEKREHYQQIPSLRDYVLVGSWTHAVAGPGEELALDALGCSLATDDVYRNVELG